MRKSEEGLKIREEVIGKSNSDLVTASLEGIAPDVDTYTQVIFAEMSARGVLDMQQRELVTLACLLTQGDTAAQLKIHIQAAMNVGLSQEEIVECFIHCLSYVGFPKVLNAISVLKTVVTDL